MEEQTVVYKEHIWTDDEIEALGEVRIEDPKTWPVGMVEEYESLMKESPRWQEFSMNDVKDIKACLLWEAMKKRLAPRLAFMDALFDVLWQTVPHDRPEFRAVFELDGLGFALTEDALEATMELLPRLERLLPFKSMEEIVAMIEPLEQEQTEELELVKQEA